MNGDARSWTRRRPARRPERDAEHRDKAIVLGGSDADRLCALADAITAIAGSTRTSVHAVYVFSDGEFERTVDRLNFDLDAPPAPDAVAERYTSLRELRARLTDPRRDDDVTVDVHGAVSDDVGAALVGVASEVDADRVIVGGRTRSAAGTAGLGTVAQHVLGNAPCPVTLVREGTTLEST